MEIPSHILVSIKKASKHFQQARDNEKIVRDWLDENGLEDDTVNDQWIDTIEMGSANGATFIKFLKTL